MEDYALAVLIALFISLATHQYYLSRSNVKKAELPPGPPAEVSWLYSWWFKLPKLIPSQHPWRNLKEYTDQYGDLITLRFANGQLLFVCGNATTAESLLVKQSAQSTDRPRLIMAGEIMSGNKRVLVERLRIHTCAGQCTSSNPWRRCPGSCTPGGAPRGPPFSWNRRQSHRRRASGSRRSR